MSNKILNNNEGSWYWFVIDTIKTMKEWRKNSSQRKGKTQKHKGKRKRTQSDHRKKNSLIK